MNPNAFEQFSKQLEGARKTLELKAEVFKTLQETDNAAQAVSILEDLKVVFGHDFTRTIKPLAKTKAPVIHTHKVGSIASKIVAYLGKNPRSSAQELAEHLYGAVDTKSVKRARSAATALKDTKEVYNPDRGLWSLVGSN